MALNNLSRSLLVLGTAVGFSLFGGCEVNNSDFQADVSNSHSPRIIRSYDSEAMLSTAEQDFMGKVRGRGVKGYNGYQRNIERATVLSYVIQSLNEVVLKEVYSDPSDFPTRWGAYTVNRDNAERILEGSDSLGSHAPLTMNLILQFGERGDTLEIADYISPGVVDLYNVVLGGESFPTNVPRRKCTITRTSVTRDSNNDGEPEFQQDSKVVKTEFVSGRLDPVTFGDIKDAYNHAN